MSSQTWEDTGFVLKFIVTLTYGWDHKIFPMDFIIYES